MRNDRHSSFVIGHLQRQTAGNGEQGTGNRGGENCQNGRRRPTACIRDSAIAGGNSLNAEAAEDAEGGRPTAGVRGEGQGAQGKGQMTKDKCHFFGNRAATRAMRAMAAPHRRHRAVSGNKWYCRRNSPRDKYHVPGTPNVPHEIPPRDHAVKTF